MKNIILSVNVHTAKARYFANKEYEVDNKEYEILKQFEKGKN